MRAVILVTYRNRATHLNCFLLYMKTYFASFPIAVIEQDDALPFNRGALFNIGFREFACQYDYVILHDVDFIPAINVDYSYCEVPTLLATECSQAAYGHYADCYFGGVIGLTTNHFQAVNGFPNKFIGWGGEDDMFRRSFYKKKFLLKND